MSGSGLGISAFRAYTRRAAMRRVNNKHVVPIESWHVVKGDTVMVLEGRDRGKVGKVTQVLRKKNRVVIGGVNVRRRVFRSPAAGTSQLKAVESPLHYSNVNLVDPATNKPTRIAIRYTDAGDKVRVAKRSGTVIPWPEELKANRSLKPATPGPKDTAGDAVTRVTYAPPADLLPYLQRGSGRLWSVKGAGAVWAARARGVSPSSLSVEDTAVAPWVVRSIRLRRKDRHRILAKWSKAVERVRVGRQVSRLLEQDPTMTGVFSAAGGGSGGAGGGGGSGVAAAAAAAFLWLRSGGEAEQQEEEEAEERRVEGGEMR